MRRKNIKHILFIILSLLMIACNISPNKTRDTTSKFSGLQTGYAFLMMENPVVKNNSKATLPLNPGKFFADTPQLVTTNSSLSHDCQFNGVSVTNCMRSLYDATSTEPLQRSTESWTQNPRSAEYLQVHAFFHAKNMLERFYRSMDYTQQYLTTKHSSSVFTAAPSFPFLTPANWAWLNTSTAPQHTSQTLDIIAFCPDSPNGQPTVAYSPAERRICFGSKQVFNTHGFSFLQDPSVIHHEMGHVLVDIMINLRNSNSVVKTDLGFISYDEAGALNEGIADYMSYIMGHRNRAFEWALGKGLTLLGNYDNAIRPLSENDPIHTENISSAHHERLSYPHYVNYNPHTPNTNVEDIHMAGQIISHYLTSLTKDLKTTCHIEQETAENYVLMNITQTLAELGDLTAKGTDLNSILGNHLTNLSPHASYTWITTTKPINYKRFFQAFAKYTLHSITMDLCTAYTKDKLEQGLDRYGLLLFPTYLDDGKNTLGLTPSLAGLSPPPSSTMINPLNRSRTVLVSKDQLTLPTTQETRPQVYLLDSVSDVNNVIKSHFFKGTPLDLSLSNDLAGVRYNNDNRFFSPGEVVALSLNLANNSNIPMSGVQILGNDWDHLKKENPTDPYPKPCKINGFPGLSEGGVTDSTTTPTTGDCAYQSPNPAAPTTTTDKLEPICLVRKVDNGETTWITQNEFRNTPSLGLSAAECLAGGVNPNECLVRIVPGGDSSVFSKIDPGKTWAETMYGNSNNPTFSNSAFIVMELNKWIPQGTIFSCRFRARFTNCSDCEQDNTGATIPEPQYSGYKPYKVIDFQFSVVN